MHLIRRVHSHISIQRRIIINFWKKKKNLHPEVKQKQKQKQKQNNNNSTCLVLSLFQR